MVLRSLTAKPATDSKVEERLDRLADALEALQRRIMGPADDVWLTLKEASTVTGISARWFRDHTDTLDFIVRVTPKMLRVSRRGLLRWMESKK